MGMHSSIHHPGANSNWSNIGHRASNSSSSSSVFRCRSITQDSGPYGSSSSSSDPKSERRSSSSSLNHASSSSPSSTSAPPRSPSLIGLFFLSPLPFLLFFASALGSGGMSGISSGGGRSWNIGYRESGSRPISCSFSAWNWMPESVAKHWRIIHRNGIRARLCCVEFLTEPPPTSV